MIEDIVIGDLTTFQGSEVKSAITSMRLSWTLDQVSQLEFEVQDPDMNMWNKNYFLIRRDVVHMKQKFEMARIGIGKGEGVSPKITVEARKKAIQLMKRDKDPEAYGDISATEFARIAAARYGLKFVGEPTDKKRVIAKSSNDSTDESVWNVVQRSASDANFVVFESEDTLYFASEQWLLGKWANVVFNWPSSRTDAFSLYEIPACGRSDDDPYAATIKLVVSRENGKSLRPGMTCILNGINSFDGKYLITDVEYEEGNNNPVSVSARTPTKPKPQTTTSNTTTTQ